MTLRKAEVGSIDQPFEAKSPRHSRTTETTPANGVLGNHSREVRTPEASTASRTERQGL
jgi:hypothetical protein